MTADRKIPFGDDDHTWLIPYDDATHDVVLDRSPLDILRATPGDDGGCMNARCILAQRRSSVFPHDVFMVSTIKTRVYIVDQINDRGEPLHCIRYELAPRDQKLIDAHDKFGAGEPGRLRLRTPSDPKGSPKRASRKGVRYAEGGGHGASSGTQSTGKRRRPLKTRGTHRRFQVAALSLDLPDDRVFEAERKQA